MFWLGFYFLQEIDRKEARVYALRSAIQETFPEPNRRLLQRHAFLLYNIYPSPLSLRSPVVCFGQNCFLILVVLLYPFSE